MLNAHCDTVDVAGMAEPFSGAIRDGKVYGRGSFDMKGSLAACMAAAKALVDSGARLRGDVLVAAVADEEYGSLGTRDLIEHIKVDGAIVTEPTALDVCLAHKGYLWIEVEVSGAGGAWQQVRPWDRREYEDGSFLARAREAGTRVAGTSAASSGGSAVAARGDVERRLRLSTYAAQSS